MSAAPTSITPSRVLHLAAMPPTRRTGDLCARPYAGGVGTSRAIAQMKPVNSRATAVATFGFALPRATKRPKTRGQTQLRLPRDLPDRLRQRFLSIEHLPPEARQALIRPCRFGEQPARVRIAGLGDPAAADAGPARILRRHRPRNAISSRGCWNRRMSPTSATRPTAVTNETPRSACSASTTGAQRQPGVSCRSWSVSRSTRRSVSSIVSRYSCSAMGWGANGKLRSASHRR